MKTEGGGEAQTFDSTASAGLFVGVSEFQDPEIEHGVPFAVDDAVDLAHYFALELGLLAPEKTSLLLTGAPAKPESVERLAELSARGARLGRPRLHEIYKGLSAARKTTGAKGLFLLGAATHGIAEEGESYLVAEDTVREHPFDTSIKVAKAFAEASLVASQRALVLVDACRELLNPEAQRSLGGPKLSEAFETAISAARGVAILSGTVLGGFSFDDDKRRNGVFTSAVLDGLRGAAPAGDEGWITVHTLAPFVEDRVVSWIRANHSKLAASCKGIGLNLDVARSFPLAPHPQASQALQAFRARRAAALEHLKKFQGAVLKGTHWDLADDLLPRDKPDSEAELLLDLIEAVTESRASQQSLRGFLLDVREEKAPTIFTPHVEVVTPTLPPRVVTPREPKVGDIHEGPFGMRFCWVPRGSYTLGSPKNEPGRSGWEEEPHKVVLATGFWLGETPITQRQWNELVAEKPFYFQHCGVDCPAENINWFEALTYANLLSEREGLAPCYELLGRKGKIGKDLTYEKVVFLGGGGFCLPSDDEWEIAARAGTVTALYTGGITILGECNAPELEAIAWYCGNSFVSYEGGSYSSDWEEVQLRAKQSCPHPVRRKDANAWGLFDMLGNVFEWCDEPIGSGYARKPGGRDRVIRGGSWRSHARGVRAACRFGKHPSFRDANLGFRLAKGEGVLSRQEARSAQK